MDRFVALGIFCCSLVAACAAPPQGNEKAATSRSAVTVVPPRLLGMNLDPLNGAANPTNQQLAEVGATGVRFELHADGDLDAAFATYDPILQRYESARIRVLLILDNAMLGRTADWNDYVGRFSTLAGQVAKHYEGRVFAYEIWNEPDLDGYPRHVEPEPYAELLNASYDAIKATSSAKVVTAGLASGQPDYVTRMGDFRADALSTHPYLHWFGDGVPAGWYSMEEHIDTFAAFGRPLWFTEWGTNDGSLQSALVSNVFEHIVDDGRVEQAFFFGWSDANEAGYGLTTDGTTKKDAYATFARYGHGQDTAAAAAPAPAPAPAPEAAPAPAPAANAVDDLRIGHPLDPDLYLTQCNEAGDGQRVWQTTADDDTMGTRAVFRYPQTIVGSCGAATNGLYPVVLTAFAAGDLEGTWVTTCRGGGAQHVFLVDTAVDGHPAAEYQYDEATPNCP